MLQIIKKLRKVFEEWKENSSEEEIKVHVIVNTFLPQLNYNSEKCNFEKNMGNGFCDIFVPINEDTVLPIEVKRANENLKEKDIGQIKKYATQLGQEYAILTNGQEYMLLNFNIRSRPVIEGNILKSYIVFKFNIFKSKGKDITPLRFFEYLSLEKLFKTKLTHFFSDISQYGIWKMDEKISDVSWWAYRSTLYNFYDFVANKYKKYEMTYLRLTEEDFHEFIVCCKRHSGETSIKTIENNYTHIFDMLSFLKENGKIPHHNFNAKRKEGVAKFSETVKKKTPTIITGNGIQEVVKMYEDKRNANRNIVAFLMCATMGMERSEVIKVTWEQFDKKFQYIYLYGRKIEIHNMLRKYLLLLNKEQGRKNGYIFVSRYKGKCKQLNDGAINEALDQLRSIEEFGKECSPQFLRSCLILTMFYYGYTLEDIMFVTNIEMKNLANYITKDMIIKRKRKVNWSKLYDGELVR